MTIAYIALAILFLIGIALTIRLVWAQRRHEQYRERQKKLIKTYYGGE